MRNDARPRNSRRHFLGQCAAATMGAFVENVNGQGDSNSFDPEQIRLIKEFADAYCVATSPDSTKLCLYFTKHPLTTFTLGGEQRTYDTGATKDEVLRVIQMVSWRTLYSAHLRQRAAIGSFSADSEELYVATNRLPPDFRTSPQLLIDLRTADLHQHLQINKPEEPFNFYEALCDRTLLGIENQPRSFADAVIQVSLPDYREIGRVPFAVTQDIEAPNKNAGPIVSADRKTFVCAAGHSIILRRTKDLSLIWSRQIDPELYGVRRLSITPDGTRVAAAILGFDTKGAQPRGHIGVYAGKDGSPVTQIPVDGRESLAISPDGKLVAVGKQVPKAQDISMVMEIYNISSGRRITSCVHDKVPPGRHQALAASFGSEVSQFTPDGKCLVTSGNNRVKIWEIDHAK